MAPIVKIGKAKMEQVRELYACRERQHYLTDANAFLRDERTRGRMLSERYDVYDPMTSASVCGSLSTLNDFEVKSEPFDAISATSGFHVGDLETASLTNLNQEVDNNYTKVNFHRSLSNGSMPHLTSKAIGKNHGVIDLTGRAKTQKKNARNSKRANVKTSPSKKRVANKAKKNIKNKSNKSIVNKTRKRYITKKQQQKTKKNKNVLKKRVSKKNIPKRKR